MSRACVMIDFTDDSECLLLPSELSEGDRKSLEDLYAGRPDCKGHVWLSSSGTTGKKRLIAISKASLCVAATSVNEHLEVEESDRWCSPLPSTHIGGVSILARAHVSGCSVMAFPQKWDPRLFHAFLSETESTITSLVPTQVYDIVESGLRAPKALRIALIGGDRLRASLAKSAVDLGWPLLGCYGMTETAAMFAVQEPSESQPIYRALSHVRVRVKGEVLEIQSEALASGILSQNGFEEIGALKFFRTEDRAREVEEGVFQLLGRSQSTVQVKGMNVSLEDLAQSLEESLALTLEQETPIVVTSIPDARDGAQVIVCIEGPLEQQVSQIESAVSKVFPPFLSKSPVVVLRSIPRLANQKVDLTALKRVLQQEFPDDR